MLSRIRIRNVRIQKEKKPLTKIKEQVPLTSSYSVQKLAYNAIVRNNDSQSCLPFDYAKHRIISCAVKRWYIDVYVLCILTWLLFLFYSLKINLVSVSLQRSRQVFSFLSFPIFILRLSLSVLFEGRTCQTKNYHYFETVV